MKHCYILLLLSICLFSCGPEKTADIKSVTAVQSQVKYARGFDIIETNHQKQLVIKRAYPDATEVFTYNINGSVSNVNTIKTPIQKIVVTSTTHIPMLELLEVENKLVGFQNTNFVSSEKTRALIDSGNVKELGKENALNTEILFDLQPDVVVGFAMEKTNKTYNLIEAHGIPVLLNGEWLEETPLGRAEWIKFFGVLFDKEKEADSIFKRIEADYLEAKKLASIKTEKPSVISGIVYRGIWHTPGGNSFMAQFLKDANLHYFWSHTTQTGSIPLSFESVFEKGKEADIWIGPGLYTQKEELLKANPLYKEFDAFSKNKVYTNAAKKGVTGGIIYYELAATRPDLVLKDMIKIAYPDILPDYQLTFFDPLQ